MASRDNLSEHIAVTVMLLTAVLASVDHGLTMLLVDDPQIPVDQRYRLTTKANYASEYTEGTAPYTFAQDYWAQLRSATQLMFGRWISAETAGYRVGGAPGSVDGFALLDGTAGFKIAVEGILSGAATAISGFDLDDVEDIDDVLAEINTVLHTVETGAYADYDFEIDSLGRLFVSNPDDTGEDSVQVTLSAPSSGTNMLTSEYLNMASATWVDGCEVETPTAAITAIGEFYDGWFCLCQRGASAAQQVQIATYVQNLNKICVLWESTYASCNNPDSTSQAFARIHNLGYNRTVTLYDPGTLTVNPDAVFVGAYIPAKEGTCDWANWELKGATSSNLGATVKGILNAQKILYFETPDGVTHNPYGWAANGDEIRWVVGASWLYDAIQRRLFSEKIKAESWGFNVPTFGTVDSVVRQYCNEAVARGFCVNTTARPMSVSIPDPDSFDTSVRASHTAALGEVAKVPLDSAVYDMSLTVKLAV